jgi:hypothetical protein
VGEKGRLFFSLLLIFHSSSSFFFFFNFSSRGWPAETPWTRIIFVHLTEIEFQASFSKSYDQGSQSIT